MVKAFDIFKGVVGAAAAVFGALAMTNGLPPSWARWVVIGLSVSTALSQFTKQIGAAPAAPKA